MVFIGDVGRLFDRGDVIGEVGEPGRALAMSLAQTRVAWRGARKAVEKGEAPKPPKKTTEEAGADRLGAVADERIKPDQRTNCSVAEVCRGMARAVQRLVLAGARKQEIGKLCWSAIKGEAITLADKRTKNGQPQTIPLSTGPKLSSRRSPAWPAATLFSAPTERRPRSAAGLRRRG